MSIFRLSKKWRSSGGLVLSLAISVWLSACDRASSAKKVPLESAQEVIELRAPNCGAEKDCSSVTIKREVFAGQPALNQALEQKLRHQLQGNGDSSGAQGELSLEQLAQNFITEAEEVSEVSQTAWQLTGEAKMLTRRGNLLTMVISSYVYSGGAHGMPARHWMNWDLASDREVKLSDVMESQKTSEFWELAEVEHQKWLDEMTADDDFRQNWPFQRTEDFHLSKKGLVLLYGVYTLGPYSVGEIELTVPSQKLRDVVKASYLTKPISN